MDKGDSRLTIIKGSSRKGPNPSLNEQRIDVSGRKIVSSDMKRSLGTSLAIVSHT